MTKPITKRKIKIWWNKRKTVIKILLVIIVISWTYIFFIGKATIKDFTQDPIQGFSEERYTLEEKIRKCSLNVVDCNDVLIDTLIDTPMRGAIVHIKAASKYYNISEEVFLGIANAESSFRHFKCYNPWGIGNGSPRCYSSWEHSVNGFAQLIRYYYLNEGLNTPGKMLHKYVGWNNPHWVNNVRKYWNI